MMYSYESWITIFNFTKGIWKKLVPSDKTIYCTFTNLYVLFNILILVGYKKNYSILFQFVSDLYRPGKLDGVYIRQIGIISLSKFLDIAVLAYRCAFTPSGSVGKSHLGEFQETSSKSKNPNYHHLPASMGH